MNNFYTIVMRMRIILTRYIVIQNPKRKTNVSKLSFERRKRREINIEKTLKQYEHIIKLTDLNNLNNKM